MAVWFDKSATTFAEAPFEQSAVSMSYALAAATAIVARGHFPDDDLAEFTTLAFLDRLNPVFMQRESAVKNIHVAGEFLDWFRFAPTAVQNGEGIAIDVGPQAVGDALALHNMNLHAALLMTPKLQEAAKELPKLLHILADATLFYRDPNSSSRDFLTWLVADQLKKGLGNASGLTKFSDTLESLDVFGTAAIAAIQDALVIAVIAYFDVQPDPGAAEDFIRTNGGAIGFSESSAPDANWYKAVFQLQAAVNELVDAIDRKRLALYLGDDWYFQNGTGAMSWADRLGRDDVAVGGTAGDDLTGGEGHDLLIGLSGADNLIGGNGYDSLVGGNGDDLLEGGAADDYLSGGEGFDTYKFSGDFGIDRIVDTDGNGELMFGSQRLSGGKRQTDGSYSGQDDKWIYVKTEKGLIVRNKEISGYIVIEDWVQGQLGINLDDTQEAPFVSNVFIGDIAKDFEAPYDDYGNYQGNGAEADAEDVLTGSQGADSMAGLGGNDFLDGQGGDDYIEGGTGNDVLHGGNGADTLIGGEGSDWIMGSRQVYGPGRGSSNEYEKIGDDEGFAAAGWNWYWYTRSIDSDGFASVWLYGTSGVLLREPDEGNVIDAGSGDDHVFAGFADDIVDGGDGRDQIFGMAGNDVLGGGAGNDLIFGDGISGDETMPGNIEDYLLSFLKPEDHGNDVINAGDGNDIAYGQGGDDEVNGGAGDDTLYGDDRRLEYTPVSRHGNDHLDGGDGNDVIFGGGLSDVILGGEGNDSMWGDSGAYDAGSPEYLDPALHGDDFIDGQGGDDYLQGEGGDDTLFGGSGADTLFGDDAESRLPVGGDDYLDGGEGDDQISGGGGSDVLFGGDGNDLLYADGSPGEVAAPAHGDDALYGGSGNDTLLGGGGADTLEGGDGADELIGDMNGGALDGSFHGDDVLVGGQGDDSLFGLGGSDQLIGGTGDDVLQGDGATSDAPASYHGDDFLDGGAGNDTLFGDGGDDVLLGGEGNDMLLGDDQSLPQHAHGDDFIDGGAGNDTIIGYGGNDELHGGGGDDLLSGDSQDPYAVAEADGADTISGGDGNDQITGNGGNDQLFGGTGDDLIFGGVGDDVIEGGSGADTLIGGEGNDVIYVDGNDYADGGAGNDTYVLNADADQSREGLSLLINDKEGANTLDLRSVALPDAPAPRARIINGAVTVIVNDAFKITLGPDTDPAKTIIRTSGGDFNLRDLLPVSARPGQFQSGYWDPTTNTVVDTASLSVNQSITGSNVGDELRGGSGNDMLDGMRGDDDLTGGVGDDQLIGGEGSDVLIGGSGNDVLVGNQANGTDDGQTDIFRFNQGDGQDWILGSAGTQALDVIRFGEGITADDLVLTNLFAGTSLRGLQLEIAYGNGDRITLQAGAEGTIQRIEFHDGSSISMDALIAPLLDSTPNDDGVIIGTNAGDLLSGTSGDDRLEGRLGDDTLVGGMGRDVLLGGAGRNTYRFRAGDGEDLIAPTAGELGILAFDQILQVAVEGDDVLIRHGMGDVVRLRGAAVNASVLSSWTVQITGDSPVRLSDLLPADSGEVALSERQRAFAERQRWELASQAQSFVRDTGLGVVPVSVTQLAVQATAGEITELSSSLSVTEVARTVTVTVTEPIYQELVSLGSTTSRFVKLEDLIDPKTGYGQIPGNATYVYEFDSGGIDHSRRLVGFLIPADNDDGGTKSNWVIVGYNTRTETRTEYSRADEALRQTVVGTGSDDVIRAGSGDGQFVSTFKGSIHTGAGNDRVELNSAVYSPWGGSTSNGNQDWGRVDIAEGALPLSLAVFNHFDRGSGAWVDLGVGDDVVFGTDGHDVIIGGDGNDWLNGQAGADRYLVGGQAGEVDHISDTAAFDASDPLYLSYGGSLIGNQDTVEFDEDIDLSQLSYRWTPVDEFSGLLGLELFKEGSLFLTIDYRSNILDTMHGTLSQVGVERFEFANGQVLWLRDLLAAIPAAAGTGPVQRIGTAGDDRLYGGSGHDTLHGAAGADLLDGGRGADLMTGGEGDDRYVVDHSGDQILEVEDGGYDAVNAYVDHTLTDHVEELWLMGSATVGIGNAQDNWIEGNDLDNVLSGGTGQDGLFGRNGADLLLGGDGHDTLDGGDGADTLVAGEGDDNLSGGEGDDDLSGGAGQDRLSDWSETSNDRYRWSVGDGRDWLMDRGGQDVIEFGEGITASQLRFEQGWDGSLSISVIDAQGVVDNGLTVEGWFYGESNQVERLEFADGSSLSNADVQGLIDAMATFGSRNAEGDSTVTATAEYRWRQPDLTVSA